MLDKDEEELENQAKLRLRKDWFKIPHSELEVLEVLKKNPGYNVFLVNYKENLVQYKFWNIPKTSVSKETKATFEDELSILGSIANPFVLDFYGFVSEELKLGLVFENPFKGSLKNFIISNKGKLTFKEKIRLSKEICQGMMHIHSKEMIHKSLAPDNVGLSEHTSCKLGGFEYARFLKDVSASDSYRKDYFSAPELVQRKKYGQMVDSWSVAFLLWELFHEKIQPFSSVVDADKKLANDPSFRPELNKGVSKHNELRNVINTCWNEDPSKRYTFKKVFTRFEALEKRLFTEILIYVQEENGRLEEFLLPEKTQEALHKIIFQKWGLKRHVRRVQLKTPSVSVDITHATDLSTLIVDDSKVTVSFVDVRKMDEDSKKEKVSTRLLPIGSQSSSSEFKDVLNESDWKFVKNEDTIFFEFYSEEEISRILCQKEK